MTPFVLRSRDGFFCKDGRGWFTAASGLARGYDWPPPPTLRGALRGAAGRQLETSLGQRLVPAEWPSRTEGVALGRTLPLRRPADALSFSREQRLWPAPADAVWVTGSEEAERLLPEVSVVPTLGARGQTAIERLWRDARVLGIGGGATEVMLEEVAKRY